MWCFASIGMELAIALNHSNWPATYYTVVVFTIFVVQEVKVQCYGLVTSDPSLLLNDILLYYGNMRSLWVLETIDTSIRVFPLNTWVVHSDSVWAMPKLQPMLPQPPNALLNGQQPCLGAEQNWSTSWLSESEPMHFVVVKVRVGEQLFCCWNSLGGIPKLLSSPRSLPQWLLCTRLCSKKECNYDRGVFWGGGVCGAYVFARMVLRCESGWWNTYNNLQVLVLGFLDSTQY